MRATSATQHVLSHEPPKTDDDITIEPLDNPRGAQRKEPQRRSSAERQYRHFMRRYSVRRLDGKFTAEQMDLMAQVSQPHCRQIKISLGTPFFIQPFVTKGDPHPARGGALG